MIQLFTVVSKPTFKTTKDMDLMETLNAHIVKMGSKFSHAGGHPLNVIKKLV